MKKTQKPATVQAALGLPTPDQLSQAARESKAKIEGPPSVGMLPIGKIDPSPANPRSNFGDMKALAASVKAAGIIQPIIVRRVGERFEVIAGHRRLRAAQAAGLKHVPANIVEAGDAQVAEAQLVENLQRQGIDAIEEAKGYQNLRDRHYSVDQIAAKVGKSRETVYQRLKLLTLTSRAKNAVKDGDLDPTVAVMLARKAQGKAQEALLEKVVGLSLREATDLLNTQTTRGLRGAPFDTDDDALLPAAGSCAACPKRSGNAPALFPGVDAAEVCGDVACWDEKARLQWVRQTDKLKKEGVIMLTPAASRKHFANGQLKATSPFVACNAPAPRDEKRRTWKQLVGKAKPQVHVLADPLLRAVVCYRRDDVLTLLADAGVPWAKEQTEDIAPKPNESWLKADNDRTVRSIVLDNFASFYAGKVEAVRLPQLAQMAKAIHSHRPLTDAARQVLAEPKIETLEEVLNLANEAQLLKVLWLTLFVDSLIAENWSGYDADTEALMLVSGFDLQQQEKTARASLEKREEQQVAQQIATDAPTTDAPPRAPEVVEEPVFAPPPELTPAGKVRKLQLKDLPPADHAPIVETTITVETTPQDDEAEEAPPAFSTDEF